MVEAAREDRFAALWRELEAVPEGYFAEIAGGEVRVLPRPGPRHTRAASRLGGALERLQGDDDDRGWVILDEPDIRLSDDVRAPDLAGWRSERYAEPDRGPYTVVPAWICEILSPSTARIDRAEKMPLYARHGVGHLWLIDPEAKTLEVHRRQSELWLVVAVHGGDTKVRAEPFECTERSVRSLPKEVPRRPATRFAPQVRNLERSSEHEETESFELDLARLWRMPGRPE